MKAFPVVLVICASLFAQTPQTPPVFRGGTTLVPLTVTVLDKKGQPITDLTQAEFTVLENGVTQELRAFFPQRMTAQQVTDAHAPVVRGATSDPLAPATRRTFLLVLGGGRIQVPGKGVDGALKFVRESLLPQDLVAILAFNRASEFTANRAETLAILERYKKEHERIFFEIREFRIRNPRTDLPESFQKDMDAVFGGLPIRPATDLLLGMDSVKKLNEPGWNRQENLSETLLRASRVPMKLTEQMIATPRLRVYAGISYLRGVEGQRHLVWIGSVFDAGSVEEDRHMAARANDARIILDIIHTTGVSPTGRGGRPSGWSWGPASAENMTEMTGGYFTGVNYADVALARIDERSRVSYLLGYAPANTTLDGKYREIKVSVNRPDVTVVFQRGYYATGEPSPVDLREMVTDARLAAAGTSDEVGGGIELTANASSVSVFGRTEMRVDLVVDPSRLTFTANEGRRTATLDVQIFCGDPKEKLVGDLKRRLDLTLDDAEYQRVLKDKIPISLRVPVSGPVKYVKVAVYDYGADLLGATFLTLK
jgi:VWFA-related protein